MNGAALISDLTVEIDAGHVVVQQTDIVNVYKIMAAKFFTRSRVELDQRLTNIETTIRDLIPRIITIEHCLGIGTKQSRVFTTEAYPEEWSLRRDEDYVSFAKKKILQLRNDFAWRQCFASYQLEGLTEQQRSKIDFILTTGPINLSKIVNSISLILIGTEDIKNYLIGVHGETVKKTSRVNTDMRPILPIEKENRLRTFFSLIDKVFITPKGWETLIRKPINQMGREFFSGKRKISDTLAVDNQAIFMHSFLKKAKAVTGQEKNAIENNSLVSNNEQSSNVRTMAIPSSARSTEVNPRSSETSLTGDELNPRYNYIRSRLDDLWK